MKKLKPNMYVRTKWGINKINEYVPQSGQLYLKTDVCHKSNVYKASYDIIDLIEPSDLMYIDISPDNYGGIVVPRVAETLTELEKWKERISSGECILKAILTKEQIINNWYEVSNNVKS